MQGTILILDSVSTNRIMLKVQLSASHYHVVQSDRLDGLLDLARRCRPDAVITAMDLCDGDARAVRQILAQDEMLAEIPIIAVTAQNDRAARLRALDVGLDDAQSHPLDDTVLQARLRSLIRSHGAAEDLRMRDGATGTYGFAEAPAGGSPIALAPVARIAVLTGAASTGADWKAALTPLMPHHLSVVRQDQMQQLLAAPVPDAIVIELDGQNDTAALRQLADLRASHATRQSALIAVCWPAARARAADALDRGAHDVMPDGFHAGELALRLAIQLRRKARSDQLRNRVRDGLRASVIDPMTGLFNRRYALPRLADIARNAADTARPFAVMLADLDHFKQVNDRFGHGAGDAVLTEVADRLRRQLRRDDLIARVGGEEFLVALPDTDREAATAMARTLCRAINGAPFDLPGPVPPVPLTISIGVVIGPCFGQIGRAGEQIGADMARDEQPSTLLMTQADRALYKAKHAGRNQVTVLGTAA